MKFVTFGLASIMFLLQSCANYQGVYVKVVDLATLVPLEHASLTTNTVEGFAVGASDMVRPNWSYRKMPNAETDGAGRAFIKVPLASSKGMRVLDSHDRGYGRDDILVSEIVVSKDGYEQQVLSRSTTQWKALPRTNSHENPLVVELRKER